MSTIKKSDVVARYGGKEFFIILPETELKKAVIVAEKIRKAIEFYPINHNENSPIYVTVSIGVTELSKGDGKLSLVKRADIGLYMAKEQGKNKVVKMEHL